MDPIDFYQALLSRDGFNTTSLARHLRAHHFTEKRLQTQLSRWEGRKSHEPRMATLEPVADFFGVDVKAFYNPAVAAKEARRLGLPGAGTVRESENRNVQNLPAEAARPAWPFPGVDEVLAAKATLEHRQLLAGALLQASTQLGIDIRKRRSA